MENIKFIAGLEPAIPSSERPQNHALDRAATGNSYVFRIPIIELYVSPITTDIVRHNVKCKPIAQREDSFLSCTVKY